MIAAVARKSNGVMAPRLAGPPLGPDLRLYKEKPQPVTRLKVQRNQLAEAVALPVRLDVDAEQVIHKLKSMSAAPSGGGTSGGDKEGWRPRWNNSWGKSWGEHFPGLGVIHNILANAELMTPIGRAFIPDPHYQGDGLSPPQRDPLVHYINNVIPWDHALLEAREKADKATLHSKRERAQRKELKEKPPDNGSVGRTQSSALFDSVSLKAANDSGSVLKEDIPYLKEQHRLRLLNIHVTVEQLKQARDNMLKQVEVETVLDVSKIDEALPWDEDDEAFDWLPDELAALNKQALAELRAEKLLDEQQRTYESDISPVKSHEEQSEVVNRILMFPDKIAHLMNRDGGVNLGVGCVASYSAEYPGEIEICFQIASNLWYEVKIGDVQFFEYLENADLEEDDFWWESGYPKLLLRESAKRVFGRYDLMSWKDAGDNEFLLWPVTDLYKVGNWVKGTENNHKNRALWENTPSDAALQLEYKEYRRDLHHHMVRQHTKKARLKMFGCPNPHAEDSYRYAAWQEKVSMFNKVRDDEQYWTWLEWTACLNPVRPTLLQRVKGSVLGRLSKLSSWMNEEVDVSLRRKNIRPQVMEEITEYEQMKLDAIARAIVQKARENKSPLKDGRLHDDDHDLKFLEGLGVTREEVIDYKVKKMGLPEDKYTLSAGGIVVPKLFTFSSIDPLKLK